jgi:ketosteroid isomerase-like protein
MPPDNLATIRSLSDAYARKDIPAIFALLAPEVEIHQSDQLPWGGHYRGHEGARQFFERLAGQILSRVDVDTLFEAGDQVVAVGHSRGQVHATGAAFEVPAVHVWTLGGGRVQQFEAYIDTPAMLRALGRPREG